MFKFYTDDEGRRWRRSKEYGSQMLHPDGHWEWPGFTASFLVADDDGKAYCWTPWANWFVLEGDRWRGCYAPPEGILGLPPEPEYNEADREVFGETLDEPIPDDLWLMIVG